MFNMEQYIMRCLLSLINQNIDSCRYEVLVVNDGSKDNSEQLVLNLAKKYKNIKLLSQENQGLSGARNTGLKSAKGEYVWFIDSDDWIEENCLNDLLELLTLKSLDILEFNYKYAFEECGNLKYSRDPFMDSIKTETTVSGISFLNSFGYVISVTSKIIKRSLFIENNLFFPLGVFSEDNLIAFKLMLESQRYFKINNAYYYYYQRKNSITNNRSKEHLLKYAEDQLHNILLLKTSIDNAKSYTKDLDTYQLYGMINFLAENLCYALLKQNEYKKLRLYIKEMVDQKVFPLSFSFYRSFDLRRLLFRLFINGLSFVL